MLSNKGEGTKQPQQQQQQQQQQQEEVTSHIASEQVCNM